MVNNMDNKSNKQDKRPIWQIEIMKQRKNVNCYYCDTTIIKKLKYYGNPIQYKLECNSMMLFSGEKLMLEFLDRSNTEFEKGWLLKLGYECTEKNEPMNVFEKSEDVSKIKEKYNIEPPTFIPEVPNFNIKCNIFMSKISLHYDSLYSEFRDKLRDCLPKYKENYKEFLKCIDDKGIIHKEITINKDDIPLDKEESDRGIRRTYTYTCPENSIIIMNNKNINEGIDDIYIQ